MAHVFSYRHFIGDVPAGLIVCHTCDNPSCVNPHHLWLGTHADNANDKYSKGRGPGVFAWGERAGNAKLTEAAVREIRATPPGRRNSRALADKYGVAVTYLNMIRRRRRWAHVPD